MAEYVCNSDCYWNRRFWKKGARYSGKEVPPKHFVPVGAYEEDKPVGDDLGGKMSLGEAHAKLNPKRKKTGEEPKTLGEIDLFS